MHIHHMHGTQYSFTSGRHTRTTDMDSISCCESFCGDHWTRPLIGQCEKHVQYWSKNRSFSNSFVVLRTHTHMLDTCWTRRTRDEPRNESSIFTSECQSSKILKKKKMDERETYFLFFRPWRHRLHHLNSMFNYGDWFDFRNGKWECWSKCMQLTHSIFQYLHPSRHSHVTRRSARKSSTACPLAGPRFNSLFIPFFMWLTYKWLDECVTYGRTGKDNGPHLAVCDLCVRCVQHCRVTATEIVNYISARK